MTNKKYNYDALLTFDLENNVNSNHNTTLNQLLVFVRALLRFYFSA